MDIDFDDFTKIKSDVDDAIPKLKTLKLMTNIMNKGQLDARLELYQNINSLVGNYNTDVLRHSIGVKSNIYKNKLQFA